MNVVPDARAVGCRIICAEDAYARLASYCGVESKGNQVRFRVVVLADIAIRIGAGRIEIPQRQVLDTVGLAKPPQCSLKRQLRFAIRIDRPLRRALVNWNLLWNAVRSTRR